MRILLTGGTGYIGSHTAVCLIEQGHQVLCFDNLSNSKPDVVDRIHAITGSRPSLIVGDVRDQNRIEEVIAIHSIEAVIHFAALKSVGEAVADPLSYYDNNVAGTISLLRAMSARGLRTLVFSSSATVYGQPRYVPLDESHPTSATNPYGRTKLVIEEMLQDIAAADAAWRIAVLRYFNPVGAHESGLIGEDPHGLPNNLVPYVSRVASGRLEELQVFGGDYDTPDGTGVRDYIHVEDLAKGHLAALDAIGSRDQPIGTWNLGTGQGYSVLDLVRAYEEANKVSVPLRIVGRRAGDVAICYASPDKAREELGWTASLGLPSMCRSSWEFEKSSSSPQF